MKLIVAFLLMPMVAFTQAMVTATDIQKTDQQLISYLQTEDLNILPSTVRAIRFIEKIGANPEHYKQHQQRFLRQIFVKTHSRFLRTFKQDAVFSQLFSNGNYNCLTATAFLGTMISHFGYDMRIFETNHHIFILVQTDHGNTLLETTDPINGFITDERTIEEKIALYKAATRGETNSKVIQYKFQSDLYNEVNLENITGLLHFNLSVNAYNAKEFTRAVAHLEQASDYYQSARIVEFSEVLLLTIRELKVKNAIDLNSRVQIVRKNSMAVVATSKKKF